MSKEQDILTLAIDRFKVARDSDASERLAADQDKSFAINDGQAQWPASMRQTRLNESPPRPCLVLNKIPEKIDQVEGEFRQLKPSIKVRGVDSQADPKIAEILNGIIRHIEYNSNARSAYNACHSSVLYCGRGAWRIDIEDSPGDPFLRDIVINPIPNVLTVYRDPAAKKADKSDAMYIFVTEEITEREFKAEYPKADLKEWDGDDATMEGWRTDKTVRVAEYWWKEKVNKTFYQVERMVDGMPVVMTVTEKRDDDTVLAEKTGKQIKVKWCKMIHGKILEGPYDDWPSQYIPIIVETGKEVNIKGQAKTRGMVRFAQEPQRMYNYWSSTVTEQIALAPKSPYLVTAKMIGPHQRQWDQSNIKNYPYLLYDVDTSSPTLFPKREPPPQLSTAVASELARMEHDIMAAMGIYQASLGDEGQEKSGRAIIARQRQGGIGSYTYVDNFHTALTYSARILIDLIPYVYDTERVVRIIGEDDIEKNVPINARQEAPIARGVDAGLLSVAGSGYINDLSIGKYDATATIGPSYTTQRQETLEALVNLINSVPQAGQVIMDLLVKYMDVPGAEELAARLKKMVPVEIRGLDPGEEPPQQQQDPKIMIEMQKLQLKAQDQQRKAFETAIKNFEAQINAIKTLAEAEAVERGEQLTEMRAFMEDILMRTQQGGPQNAGQGQEGQGRLQG